MFTIFCILWLISVIYSLFNLKHMSTVYKSKGEMYTMIIFGGPLAAATCMFYKATYDKDYRKVVQTRITAELNKTIAKYEQFLNEVQ